MNDKDYFSLGHLTTESCHPLTRNMSFDCEGNLAKAISDFYEVDKLALASLKDNIHKLEPLIFAIERSLRSGGRLIVCGCGATGRLSLALESFFKEKFGAKLLSFMAGGDSALIKSIEKFEDYPEFGKEQLHLFNASEADLVIGITEGGETPFVIGAVEEASKICREKPFFIYCNPDEELLPVERSRRVIENLAIEKVNLTCGPMALAGSTRLQATTVQLLFMCLALERAFNEKINVSDLFKEFVDLHQKSEFLKLIPFIEWESGLYKKNEKVNYFVSGLNALSVLTDTTERAPTFGLSPFDSVSSGKRDSFVYCFMDNAQSAFDGWIKMLGRRPRTLNWHGHGGQTQFSYLMDMDISSHNPRSKDVEHSVHLHHRDDKLILNFDKMNIEFTSSFQYTWMEQVFLKLVLNMHSTLVMGCLGRYVENLMVWVRPSNGKLINRACRYADILLKEKGIALEYDIIEKKCLDLYQSMPHNRSIVLEIVKALS